MTVADFCFRHVFDVFEVFDFSDDRCTKSSFGKKTEFIFSNFPKKRLGPGASEKPSGLSKAVRGASWELPGGPGGILGGSWAVLGRSWSDFLNSPTSHRFFDRF